MLVREREKEMKSVDKSKILIFFNFPDICFRFLFLFPNRLHCGNTYTGSNKSMMNIYQEDCSCSYSYSILYMCCSRTIGFLFNQIQRLIYHAQWSPAKSFKQQKQCTKWEFSRRRPLSRPLASELKHHMTNIDIFLTPCNLKNK